MQLSTAVASAAMILAVALAAGYAQGEPALPEVATQQEKAPDVN